MGAGVIVGASGRVADVVAAVVVVEPAGVDMLTLKLTLRLIDVNYSQRRESDEYRKTLSEVK